MSGCPCRLQPTSLSSWVLLFLVKLVPLLQLARFTVASCGTTLSLRLLLSLTNAVLAFIKLPCCENKINGTNRAGQGYHGIQLLLVMSVLSVVFNSLLLRMGVDCCPPVLAGNMEKRMHQTVLPIHGLGV